MYHAKDYTHLLSIWYKNDLIKYVALKHHKTL